MLRASLASAPVPAQALVLAQASVSSRHAAGVSEYAPALPPTKCRHASGRISVASAIDHDGQRSQRVAAPRRQLLPAAPVLPAVQHRLDQLPRHVPPPALVGRAEHREQQLVGPRPGHRGRLR